MNFKLSLLITFIFFSLINCDSATSTDIDGEGLDLGFTVIVDSSFYRLSATHNSHIYKYEELSNNNLIYTPIFALTIKLNEPSRRDEIKKLIIYDNQQYGWEFTKNELENHFSTFDSTYTFSNLLFKPAYEFADKLFFVRIIGDENQSSLDYNFIFKGDYPALLNTTNYWTSSDALEFEFSNNTFSNYPVGYNPLLDPDTVSLVWLDKNKEILSITPQIKDITEQTAYSRNFYSYTVTTSAPDGATYAYSLVSESRFNNEYQLITSVDPIIDRLPFITDFFELSNSDQKIIYSDNETAIFLTPSSIDQNQFSSLLIYDLINNNELTEINIFGRFFDENNLVHYSASQQSLYFFDQNREASYYNLETEQQVNLGFTSTDQYYNYILPFGESIIYYTRNSNGHLFNINNNEVVDINFNISFRDYNSYFYSVDTKALYMGDESSESFIKITTTDSVTFTGEVNYRNNNLSSYSRSKLKLHYSSSDSSLIHSSGAILSLKNSISFTEPSTLTSIPFLSSFASGWLDEEKLLFVLDNQSNEKIRVFKKIDNNFTEYGYLESYGSPLDIFVDRDSIKVSSYYYQGSNSQPITILVSYSLDDIKPYSDLEKTSSRYTKMKKVSLN